MAAPDSVEKSADTTAVAAPPAVPPPRKLFGVNPIKWVFALEYMLQGIANPFQGTTYQPFFRHLRFDYGLSEAATQTLFARSYLAWSFKPVLGFFIDAYGRTRTLLLVLLGAGVVGYLFTPVFDQGPGWFFWLMFVLSVGFAGTDVAVDRATVLEGAEEAKSTGRSKATAVGLNQAICWISIYGTGFLAALLGGYLSEAVHVHHLMLGLALVPFLVFLAVWRLPRDRATPIKVTQSILQFWSGLNTGPILGVMAFYFIFNFQPAAGPLLNDYQIQQLHFTQTQVGFSDAAAYLGSFVGVVVFTTKGIRWQDQMGLKKLFRVFILVSAVVKITQYLQVNPGFDLVAGGLGRALPFLDETTVRVGYLCLYNFLLYAPLALIRMSTFSLVGSVIPTAAAGSLFAGFMSVSNLGTSFGYQSGSWLYEHGMGIGVLRALQSGLFGVDGKPGDNLSISMLILINSLGFMLSFACVHVLPDRKATLATEGSEQAHAGPERWRVLDPGAKRGLDIAAIALGLSVYAALLFVLHFEPISGALISFFGFALLRKALLDTLLRRAQPAAA